MHHPSLPKRGDWQEHATTVSKAALCTWGSSQFHKVARATMETALKPGHQLACNSLQHCSCMRSSCIAPMGLEFPSQIRQDTHDRLKRCRHLHISSGFDRFLVIYSATCKYPKSTLDGYLLYPKVNRSVCIGLNIYIKEAHFLI